MIRSGLICAISDKMLKLGSRDAESEAGYTLVSTDVERLCQGLRNMHEAWANIMEVGIATYLLARQLGVAALAPLVLVAGMFHSLCSSQYTSLLIWRYTGCTVASSRFSGKVEKSQREWLGACQDRLSHTSSILGNLKGVKLLGLSSRSIQDLCRLRETELNVSLHFRRLLVWIVGFCKYSSEANHRERVN